MSVDADRLPRGLDSAARAPHRSGRDRWALDCTPVPARDGGIDGCDGTHARGRPADGAFVLVKEILDGASLRRSLPRLPSRPRRFRLPTHGQAGCPTPPSATYQFRVAKRAFYVWLSVGRRASRRTRAALTRLLDRIRIARYAAP
jgi:hypothetical protein